MSAPNIKDAFEVFLFSHLAEYSRTQMPEGVKMSARIWQEQVKAAHEAWHGSRKPKRKKPIADDGAWLASLKGDPAMEGVDVDKEVAKCHFWCRNQTPPVKASRRRLVNWLNKADRVVGINPSRTALVTPYGWLDWMRANSPDWRRFKEESEDGHAVPAWGALTKEEREFIDKAMKEKTE